MNELNYPNGKKATFEKKEIIKKRNPIKSRLGQDFEDAINSSCAYYLSKGLAAIYKKPTPIQIVKVDYPSRNKARIVEAYYKLPSTTDYNGIYKGHYIDFEAKSCHETSFSFGNIYEHQINHLETVWNMGGISFLIIQFTKYNEVFILPTPLLVAEAKKAKEGGRKSISHNFFKEFGYLVKCGYNPQIDFLEIVENEFIQK